jgi:hypothetical protein
MNAAGMHSAGLHAARMRPAGMRAMGLSGGSGSLGILSICVLLVGLTGCATQSVATKKTEPAPVIVRKAPLSGLHYNVSMPGLAVRTDMPDDDMTGYVSNVGDLQYVAYEQQTVDYDLSDKPQEIEEVLDGACKGFVEGAKGKEKKRVNIAQDVWPGKEVEGSNSTTGDYRIRVYFDPIKGRTMFVGVIGPKKSIAAKAVDTFFASFSAPVAP